ncbi:uncharacterized protein LOC107611586 [Arachis ipaensis]|uniref:uncharacterized protein LOC107611586 n=1 Tax=Arachis ipaensis TaxID=130454 RepID=UPI0007AEFCD5|nr:uncharacterized protein LOC107611586 [Arachis ipaensis]
MGTKPSEPAEPTQTFLFTVLLQLLATGNDDNDNCNNDGGNPPTELEADRRLQDVKQVEKLFYRIPISILRDDVRYDSFVIKSDEDLQVLFHCRRQFLEVRTPKMLAKLVDVVSNSGGSNWNPQPPTTATCSSSRPVGASSSVSVIAPEAMLVASLSFATDLNSSRDEEIGDTTIVGFTNMALVPLHNGASDGVDDVLWDDDDDDDVEPETIVDDSGDDIAGSNPAEGGGAFSSSTQQYPPHFSTLNLDAMRQQGYKVVESDYRKYYGKYKEFGNECTWLIRTSLCQCRGIWEVKRYNRPHTCLAISILSDHRSLDYHVISAFILQMVRADAAVCIKITMPGTIAVLKTSPMRVGGQVDDSAGYFHRLFWTFPLCIEAFYHCKPLVSVDGTHLYGKYGGTLLVAIAQHGNSNIIPIAFALVEGENAELWAFSIRHVVANFTLNFKGKDAQRLLINAAYAKTEAEFHYWFDILHAKDLTMCDWANRIDYAHWTHHWDEGRRFGHMTTNISECVNSILKGVRNLPICALVKATYGRLAELFVQKRREAKAQLGTEQQFSQHLIKEIKANLKTSWCFTMTVYDRDNSEFTVAETTPTGSFSLGTYRVSLTDQTCDCDYFQALHYPCRHALACCAYARLTWSTYVHEVYRLSSVFDVYRMVFTPPIPEGFWPPYDGPTVIPNPAKRHASEGRPRTTKIRTTMDEAILPMIRADAAMCIKVLLNATEAHFGFRPTYRRVWLA